MDIQLGFGIYNYYAEMIPEKYPFVKPFMIFFPSGDKKKGIEQLEAAAMEGKYSKYESRYFLMTLFYQHENNFSKALEYAEMLTGDFPDNPIFQRHHGRILVRMGFYRRATRIFSDILKKCEAKLRGYSESSKREATYYMGLNLFKDNRPDSSKVYFKESEKLSRMLIGKEYKQTGYLANTLLYLGMIEDLSGNRENAIEYYEQVLDLDDFKDSHNRAEKYIETPYKK
jgi:tetratricopeptide (TPR) repeat protein